MNVLGEEDYVSELIIPEKELPLRMFYMYKDDICTLIDVDDARQLVRIKNYTDKLMFRAFGTACGSCRLRGAI